nr:MAG TPA: hypothetical protein [Caudoviricetes sp.]
MFEIYRNALHFETDTTELIRVFVFSGRKLINL